jgi:hypothetical protein
MPRYRVRQIRSTGFAVHFARRAVRQGSQLVAGPRRRRVAATLALSGFVVLLGGWLLVSRFGWPGHSVVVAASLCWLALLAVVGARRLHTPAQLPVLSTARLSTVCEAWVITCVLVFTGVWAASRAAVGPESAPAGSRTAVANALSNPIASAPPAASAQNPSGCRETQQAHESDWGPAANPLAPVAGATVPTFNNAVMRGKPGEHDPDFRQELVSADPADTITDGGYSLHIRVQPNTVYRVRLFLFNNASPNLSGAAISEARARITVPVCPATDVRLTGTVAAPTAQPPEIWSTVHFTADKPFKLVPATRQAVVCFDRTHCAHGKGFTAFPAASQLFSQHGAPLGSDGLDGLFPPATSVDVIFYVTAVFTAETTHP